MCQSYDSYEEECGSKWLDPKQNNLFKGVSKQTSILGSDLDHRYYTTSEETQRHAVWKTWICFMKFLVLCVSFHHVLHERKIFFSRIFCQPSWESSQIFEKKLRHHLEPPATVTRMSLIGEPKRTLQLTHCYWKGQFASKWIIWIIVVDGSFKDVWIKRLPCEMIQFDHHVVFSNKVWSDSTALQESRSWVWKLSLILCFGDMEFQFTNSPRQLAALATRWTPRCRSGASPFVFCGAGSGTADIPCEIDSKNVFLMIFLFQPKTTILWSFCPFEPWPYLVFRYPVASWCISIYGENKECSYRVYVFTFIYTYSWESTTISDFEFGGDFNFKERSLGAEATVVGWWWKAWTPSEFLQDDHVLWFGGTPFQ